MAKVPIRYKVMKYSLLSAKNFIDWLVFILFKGTVTEFLLKIPLTKLQTGITYEPFVENTSFNSVKLSPESELSIDTSLEA